MKASLQFVNYLDSAGVDEHSFAYAGLGPHPH